MYLFLHILLTALALLSSTCTTHCTEPTLLPLSREMGVWWLQHEVSGIHEGDFFSIFSFEYEFMSLYIDDNKYKPSDRRDEDDEFFVRLFMQKEKQQEIFMNVYTIPVLSPGDHTVSVSLSRMSNKEEKMKAIYPLAIIKMMMRCVPLPLLFFSGQTCSCTLDSSSIRIFHRPKDLVLP